MEANRFVADSAGVFLNTEIAEERRGRGDRGDGDGLNGVDGASMRNGSRGLDYCQGTVINIDHSN